LGIDLNLDFSLRDRLGELGLPVLIDLICASSVDEETINWVKAHISSEDSVMIVLDSHHTHEHVLAELNAYAGLVSRGQFLIVGDTIIKDLANSTDRVREWSSTDNPHTALQEFLLSNKEFRVDERLSKKLLTTFHPGGYLRKI
jgi:cephalosporin hydroxylase